MFALEIMKLAPVIKPLITIIFFSKVVIRDSHILYYQAYSDH